MLQNAIVIMKVTKRNCKNFGKGKKAHMQNILKDWFLSTEAYNNCTDEEDKMKNGALNDTVCKKVIDKTL